MDAITKHYTASLNPKSSSSKVQTILTVFFFFFYGDAYETSPLRDLTGVLRKMYGGPQSIKREVVSGAFLTCSSNDFIKEKQYV